MKSACWIDGSDLSELFHDIFYKHFHIIKLSELDIENIDYLVCINEKKVNIENYSKCIGVKTFYKEKWPKTQFSEKLFYKYFEMVKSNDDNSMLLGLKLLFDMDIDIKHNTILKNWYANYTPKYAYSIHISYISSYIGLIIGE